MLRHVSTHGLWLTLSGTVLSECADARASVVSFLQD